MTLVNIKGLKVSFRQHGGQIDAVRGVDIQLAEGESLGIVGESGSGKSVSCLALMRLLPNTATITAASLNRCTNMKNSLECISQLLC